MFNLFISTPVTGIKLFDLVEALREALLKVLLNKYIADIS